jgi:hypothetical protein
MKRKQYEKPSIEVVVLKQAGMLMTSESVNVTMSGTWTEEILAPELTLEDDFSFLGE